MHISWIPTWTKAYPVYDLETHSIFTSNDVIFHETNFPFATNTHLPTPIHNYFTYAIPYSPVVFPTSSPS